MESRRYSLTNPHSALFGTQSMMNSREYQHSMSNQMLTVASFQQSNSSLVAQHNDSSRLSHFLQTANNEMQARYQSEAIHQSMRNSIDNVPELPRHDFLTLSTRAHVNQASHPRHASQLSSLPTAAASATVFSRQRIAPNHDVRRRSNDSSSLRSDFRSFEALGPRYAQQHTEDHYPIYDHHYYIQPPPPQQSQSQPNRLQYLQTRYPPQHNLNLLPNQRFTSQSVANNFNNIQTQHVSSGFKHHTAEDLETTSTQQLNSHFRHYH
jgi:hypothetical protein